jgi:general secretion pathway protein I
VLVALVIVAVGMAALLGALSSSASTVLYMRDKTFAEWVALNQIVNLRLQQGPGQVPAESTTTGDLDYAGRSWHWRQEIIATQISGMMRVDVKVRPAEIKAGDDNGWFVTVTGMMGDAVARPGITTAASWDGAALGSPLGNSNGTTTTTLGAGTSTQGNSSAVPNNTPGGGTSNGTNVPTTVPPTTNTGTNP